MNMEKKSVVLVSAGVSRKENPKFSRFQTLAAPGIYYLKVALLNEGFDVKVVDQPTLGLSDEEVSSRIDEIKPCYVLFNQFFNTRERVKKIISGLKEEYIIGIGGHDATFNAVTVEDVGQAYKDIDFIWRGEAEERLGSFLKSFTTKQQKVMVVGHPANRITDLDSLPLLQHDEYPGDTGFIVTSRGCFKKGCDFCTTPQFYHDGLKQRSFEHVVYELKNLANNGKKYIMVTDDNFLGFTKADLERGLKIIRKCKELDLKIMILTTAGQIINSAKYGYLKEWMGTVFRVCVGVENGDESALKKLGKCGQYLCNAEKSAKAISLLIENGVSPIMGYINFNPESTFEELESSGSFLYNTKMEAAKYVNLIQDVNLFDCTPLLERFRNNGVDIYIEKSKYKFSFVRPEVGGLFKWLRTVREVTNETDSLLFNIEELFGINNQLHSETYMAYIKKRSETNEDNFRFYMDSINHFKAGHPLPDKNIFMERVKMRFKKYNEIFNEIKKVARYQ